MNTTLQTTANALRACTGSVEVTVTDRGETAVSRADINVTAQALRVNDRIRTALTITTSGLPTIQEWLNRVEAIGFAPLTEAIEGFWCGREGRQVIDLPGTRNVLVVGWYNGRVEFAYLS